MGFVRKGKGVYGGKDLWKRLSFESGWDSSEKVRESTVGRIYGKG